MKRTEKKEEKEEKLMLKNKKIIGGLIAGVVGICIIVIGAISITSVVSNNAKKVETEKKECLKFRDILGKEYNVMTQLLQQSNYYNGIDSAGFDGIDLYDAEQELDSALNESEDSILPYGCKDTSMVSSFIGTQSDDSLTMKTTGAIVLKDKSKSTHAMRAYLMYIAAYVDNLRNEMKDTNIMSVADYSHVDSEMIVVNGMLNAFKHRFGFYPKDMEF